MVQSQTLRMRYMRSQGGLLVCDRECREVLLLESRPCFETFQITNAARIRSGLFVYVSKYVSHTVVEKLIIII